MTRFNPSLLAVALLAATSPLGAADWIVTQAPNGLSSYPTYSGAEATDDFTVLGSIERIRVQGYLAGGILGDYQGVRVRIYNSTGGAPGAVAADINVGLNGVVFTNTGYATFDITLPTPFAANGTYYLSVTPIGMGWSWGSANGVGQPAFTRPSATSPWTAFGQQGLAFALFGTNTGPGQISGLSSASSTRSGYFEILGTNFGGNGRVLVNNVEAPVADWNGTRVLAYVPEAVPAGSALVQVDNGAGLSNSWPLNITDRAPSGRIRWSLRMESPYAAGDPAVAPDGSLYVLDISQRLYALTATGGLRWVARGAGNRGPSLGPDGTIYAGNESTIKAYNPDGTLKWVYVQPSFAFFLFDVAVGPDGNIYAVAVNGQGTFSLTPQGTLRWAFPEQYNRPIVDRGHIVFGPNSARQQLYFYSNAHTLTYDLAGSLVNSALPTAQPRVSQLDGSVHIRNEAYTPNAQRLWTAPQLSLLTTWGLGADGTHYGVDGQTSTLWAIRPDGTPGWSLPMSTSRYFSFLGANQLNNTIVLAGVETTGNFLQGVGIATRAEAWLVRLSADPASGSPQSVQTNPVFSPDGTTAYATTTVSGISRAYLYAVDSTGATVNQPPTARASAAPSSGTAPLVVTFAGTGSSDADGSIVSYAWNFGDGQTGSGMSVTHTYSAAGTYTARLTVTDNRGATASATVTVTVTTATSTVLRSTNISMSGRRNGSIVTATGQVTVRTTAGAASPGATVSANWREPDGSTVAQTAVTNASGVATFTTMGGRGTFTLTVVNVVKAGYTFDAAGSVLNSSITR